MGMRGRLDRRAVAHSGPILALDWSAVGPPNPDDWAGGSGGGSTSGGWVVSGSMDRCVKVWDLTVPESNFPHKPTYTLHPAFPVRRVLWREGYSCELAVVSSGEFNVGGSSQDILVDAKENERGGERAHTSALGDSVEIWDVRRPWVAKWEILGSAVEGGATGQFYHFGTTVGLYPITSP
jgi:WD repeat-containing protein 24